MTFKIWDWTGTIFCFRSALYAVIWHVLSSRQNLNDICNTDVVYRSILITQKAVDEQRISVLFHGLEILNMVFRIVFMAMAPLAPGGHLITIKLSRRSFFYWYVSFDSRHFVTGKRNKDKHHSCSSVETETCCARDCCTARRNLDCYCHDILDSAVARFQDERPRFWSRIS